MVMLTIERLTVDEANALLEQHGCRPDVDVSDGEPYTGFSFWLTYPDGTLPRGPFPTMTAIIEHLAGARNDIGDTDK